MMHRPVKRSSLFLLELIIAILFFSLASAVCVQFFVKSRIISEDTKNLNIAVQQVSSQAELFLAGQEVAENVYYDENWAECEREAAVFCLTATLEEKENGRFQVGTFSVTDDKKKEIYTLSVEKYEAGEEAR